MGPTIFEMVRSRAVEYAANGFQAPRVPTDHHRFTTYRFLYFVFALHYCNPENLGVQLDLET